MNPTVYEEKESPSDFSLRYLFFASAILINRINNHYPLVYDHYSNLFVRGSIYHKSLYHNSHTSFPKSSAATKYHQIKITTIHR